MTKGEAKKKALELLTSVSCVFNDECYQTRAEFIDICWKVFDYGVEYGKLYETVNTDEGQDREIEDALVNMICGIHALQRDVIGFFDGIKGKTFDDIVSCIRKIKQE